MTNSDTAIREFASRWGLKVIEAMKGDDYIMHASDECLTDLTALISEHYYPKEKYDELLQQRDELKEALINMMVVERDCYPLLFDNEKPAVKQAEAAIKNAESSQKTEGGGE